MRQLRHNIQWLALERIVTLGVSFFVGVWFVRYLGPDDYGIFSYAQSFVALFAAVATLGLESIVVRELSRSRPDHAEVLGTAMGLTLVAGIATCALIMVSILFVTDDTLKRSLVAVLAVGTIAQATLPIESAFQAKLASKHVVVVKTVTTFISSGLRVALIVLGLSLLAFGAATTAGVFLTSAGLFLMLARHGDYSWSFRINRGIAKELLRDSWPLVLAGIFITLYMRIDRIMLEELTSTRELGIFSTAALLSEVWHFVPVVISASVLPVLSRNTPTTDQQDPAYRQRLQVLFDAMAALSYAIAIPTTFLAEPIVHLLFGAEYEGAAEILQIHVWGFVFVALGVARSAYLIAHNLVRFSMLTTLMGCIVNIVLNLLLIPRYGGVGAAVATLVAYAVASHISCLALRSLWPVAYQMTIALLVPLRVRSVIRSWRAVLREW